VEVAGEGAGEMKKVLFLSLVFVLLAVIGYSGYQLWEIERSTAQEAEVHRWLMQYRPVAQPPRATAGADGEVSAELSGESSGAAAPEAAPAPQIVNQSIVDLQAGLPDVVGWLTVPNTRVDYPFAQGVGNDTYLHLDLNQRWSAAGTIFMDFRNSRDLSDFNTIIYGHHMRNGSMFGTLQQFSNRAFFEANRTGTIFLAHATYEIEFMAFVVLRANDGLIFNPLLSEEADRVAFLDHVEGGARYFRDVGATADDRLVTLSTCNYEFHNARMVLIGRIV